MIMDIRTREWWRAREPKAVRKLPQGPAPEVIFHWPGVDYGIRKALQEVLRSIQDYHLDSKEWYDIAYNFAVDRNGTIVALRGFGVEGGHTKDHNDRSLGILLLLNLDEEVSTPMTDAVAQLLRHAESEGHISRKTTILGHNELANKPCPGPSGQALVDVLKDGGWWDNRSDGSPIISPELEKAYTEILGSPPGGFAHVWQQRINEGALTLSDVKWELLAVRLAATDKVLARSKASQAKLEGFYQELRELNGI